MSRWMYLFNKDLTEEVLSGQERIRYLIGELRPHALLDAASALRGVAEAEFPGLFKIRRGNRTNLEEWQKLSPCEVRELYTEFLKLRRVCKREEYIVGVMGPAVYEEWRGIWDVSEYEEYLDLLQSYLDAAVKADGCILLT